MPFQLFSKEIEFNILNLKLDDAIHIANYSGKTQNVIIDIFDKKNRKTQVFSSPIEDKTKYFEIDSKINGKFSKYKTLILRIEEDAVFHYFMDDDELYFEFLQTELPDAPLLKKINNSVEDEILGYNWTSSEKKFEIYLRKNNGYINLGVFSIPPYTNRFEFKNDKKNRFKEYDEILVFDFSRNLNDVKLKYSVNNDDLILSMSDEIDSIVVDEKYFMGYRYYTSAKYSHKSNNVNDFVNQCVKWIINDFPVATIEYKDENLNIVKCSAEDYIFSISLDSENSAIILKVDRKAGEKTIRTQKIDDLAIALINFFN